MLQNLSRTAAARYTAFAAVPLVLGVGGVVWALQSSPTDHNAQIESIKAKSPAAATKPGGEDAAPVARTTDHAPAIAARFAALKNHPEPLDQHVVGPDLGAEPPAPTPTGPTADVKYIGPIRLGDVRLAILNLEGKQQAVGTGRSISVTVNETAHTIKVIDVTDDEVTIEENGAEHKIARAESNGERVSYLGGRPARSGKPVSLRKRDSFDPQGARENSAQADLEARKAEAIGRLAPLLDEMHKAKPERVHDIREKITQELKRTGLPPHMVDEVLGSNKSKDEEK